MIARDPFRMTSMYERNLDDSEESDGEGGVGNLNRLVIRPLGHSGKAKKGHLCFDASFETGNLGRVDLISEYEYDLFVRPDTCCPKLRMWFNFMVDNVKQDQRVIFNIVNFGKFKNLYNTEMTPIVKSSSRPKWQRLLKKNVFYHRSIYHRFRHILSFAFAFDKEEDVYHFAMATPYSYSRLQAYLDAWVRKSKHLKHAVDRQTIGKSIQKKNVDLITIGDEQSPPDASEIKGKPSKRRVVIIIARCHGGEPPSSFVCQGLMDFLISSQPMAESLRQNITIKIIPMLNPDGVHLGNQRTNLLGLDLNRSWHMISQWAHPTLKEVHDIIKGIESKKERYQLDFIIDIHAHSSLKGCFMYGNTYDDVYRYERHIVFPKIVATKAEGYCQENAFFNADSSKVGTARRFFCNTMGKNFNSFTLQVSMGGYHIPGMPHYIHYNDDAYLRLGRNLGRSLFEYYHQVNIISTPVTYVSEGRPLRKKRKSKRIKLKHPRPKATPSPRPQHCLESRVFSPSIIRPDPNKECDPFGNQAQNISNEFPIIPKRLNPKKLGMNQKIINLDEIAPKSAGINISPPPSLTIIDLNNTIRSGLNDSNLKNPLKNRETKEDFQSDRKKRFVKRITKNIKLDAFSSDEDYIDI